MSDANDYLEYAVPEPGEGDLGRLQKLAQTQAQLEADIARLEEQTAKLKERWKDVRERQLPELMDQIGMESFKTSSGLTIKVEETIRASITKEQAPKAFAWLKSHGHASLIKRTVSVSFGRGEDERAEELRKALLEQQLEPEDKAVVHPSTLSAFVREKLEKGEDIPLDLLGVHRQRFSKIEV